MGWRFFSDIVAPTLLVCWAAISLYNAAAGEAGYGALADLRLEAAEKAATVDALRARRLAMEARADMLASKSLDADMADERIRAVLGYAAQGEMIIPRNDLEAALKGPAVAVKEDR